jgi:hypothetical protein
MSIGRSVDAMVDAVSIFARIPKALHARIAVYRTKRRRRGEDDTFSAAVRALLVTALDLEDGKAAFSMARKRR